ncbi:MAG TPA: energy transducer TonB [Candidatus Binatia bacterium]|nr:energy transducer TonB [Candidatus Binatia bacterium]
MANQTLIPATAQDDLHLLPRTTMDESLWTSLLENVRAALFPEKLPPLQLTSRPVRVRPIWGEYNYKKQSAGVSLVVHSAMIAGLIWISILGARAVKNAETPRQTVELIAPDLTPPPLPMSKKSAQSSGGGGGGGDRDKLQAPKGKLPKTAMEQITPPAMVIRNDHPKLPVEPTVVVPPQIKLASNMPNLGNPMAAVPSGPPSNGTGSGGGIGSGAGGGVGSGTGPGVGPGRGGGIGGGVFRVGGGVSPPRALDTPDPEYSDEARKAKYQGTCVLWLIVGPDGKPRDVKVARALGMGLDQKAIEAVRRWKFEPATLDGKPVAVQINVEVNFRLY